MKIAHIYGQHQWHDHVAIVATEEALLEMKKGIEEALKNGNGKALTYTADGESYQIVIVKTTENESTSEYWQNVRLPYTSEHAKDEEGEITKDDFWFGNITSDEEMKKYLQYKKEEQKKYDEEENMLK